MQKVPVQQAVGQVLCHDLTRIVPGAFKGAQFCKGHVIQEEDIPLLLSMGKEHMYVCEAAPGMLHENDAAERLCRITISDHMQRSEVREGKIELVAACDGYFRVNVEQLDAINDMDDIIIATRHANTAVHKGDKLAGMRAIPLFIEEKTLEQAEMIAGSEPLLSLTPYRLKRAGVITTGSEVSRGLIADTFTPVIENKLKAYGIDIVTHITVDDERAHIAAAINEARTAGVDMLLCTGGMSVDPDDNTPGAIRDSGARIVSYGAPVLPGAMFLLGYYADGMPVMGLPGCVMYAAATVFDLLLPRIAAGIPVQKRDISRMGNGGLCLGCKDCRYPDCPFGKGI